MTSINAVEQNEYLTPFQIADAYPFWSAAFWTRMRVRGGGPKYYKVAGRVLYRRQDVETWIAAHSVTSTMDSKQRAA